MDAYEIAYLCGGAERVAVLAFATMRQEGRISISPGRHRVSVLVRQADDPIQEAVLEAVPDFGKVLGAALQAVGRSAAVAELPSSLRAAGLASRHGFGGLTREGRKVRKRLREEPGEHPIAVLGAAGIADERLRRIFETPDPPPGRALIPKDGGKPPGVPSSSSGSGGSGIGSAIYWPDGSGWDGGDHHHGQ